MISTGCFKTVFLSPCGLTCQILLELWLCRAKETPAGATLSINEVVCFFIILFFQVVISVRFVRLVREQICFHLLKRKSRLEPATTAQDIFKQPPSRRTLPAKACECRAWVPGRSVLGLTSFNKKQLRKTVRYRDCR